MLVLVITYIFYSGIKQATEAFGAISSDENNPSTSSSRTQNSSVVSNFSTSANRPSTSSDDVKLPKWFKTFGK